MCIRITDGRNYGEFGTDIVRVHLFISPLTSALQVQHGLIPLVLQLLRVRGHGEALSAGVQHDHVLVFRVSSLVDVKARIQVDNLLRHRRLAPEFLLALVVFKAGRAALRRRAEHEETPVRGFWLAQVTALADVLIASRLCGRLVLHC